MRPASLALLVAVPLAGCAGPQDSPILGPQFKVVSVSSEDLGTLGGTQSQAVAINHRGQVVGFATTASFETHAFVWEDGVMQDIGTLGGTFSRPTAINDAGQVVGNSTLPSGSTCPNPAVIDPGCRAFLWDGSTMQNLGTLGGDFSEAWAINASGEVAGFSLTAGGETHAFVWDGTMHDLGTLGGTFSIARAINATGNVVGVSETTSGESHAFFSDGTMHDLGTLGGPFSTGVAINPRGDVVGLSSLDDTPGGPAHAFLWDGTTMHDLGTLGGEQSGSLAINPKGDVVGFANTQPGPIGDQHPSLWDGTIHDLGTLG
ncbi:MAG TPA: hypothetical protein VK467_00110, partial [Gemmatimonadales bacterium]|nr:hypothetical protein [Gemmatimonadales bacterium]